MTIEKIVTAYNNNLINELTLEITIRTLYATALRMKKAGDNRAKNRLFGDARIYLRALSEIRK